MEVGVDGYRVTWQEQESYSCPTKSDKIIQGKKFAEWTRDEFPTLLSIDNLEPLGNPTSKNPSLFVMAFPIFFQNVKALKQTKRKSTILIMKKMLFVTMEFWT